MSAGNWAGGYVTDVSYTAGYYVEQSPHLLALSAAVSGAVTDVGEHIDDLVYVELGCGRGMNALIQAVANPGWQVVAVDFTPAAIAEARALAREVGIDNVTFVEADLATLAEDPAAALIPEADVVSLHGVWSWVPMEVRAGIVRLMKAKVKPGGLVHLSYNALPALQNVLGMQRVMREAGLRLAERSDRQAVAGLAVVRDLVAGDALNLRNHPVGELLQRLEGLPHEYLAHEYMNGTWAPVFHADVAGALAEAKLDFIGSARPPENFPDLMMTEPQRKVYDRFEDRLMQELVKDLCSGRGLRHDIFARGHRPLSPAGRARAMMDMTLALTVAPEKFIYSLTLPAGQATLNAPFYGTVVEALAGGPRAVGELVGLPGLDGAQRDPTELVAMLVGTGQAIMLPRPTALADARTRRFNRLVGQRAMQGGRIDAPAAVAVPRLGGGLGCRAVDVFLMDRMAEAGGAVDPDIWIAELGAATTAEDHARLRARLTELAQERAPLWRRLGML